MPRPVGHLERLSTAKHYLGYYRCIANTTRYSISQNVENLPAILQNAIAMTILQHPILGCGVINEDKDNPVFVRLKSIDLKQCVEYKEVTVSTATEYEEGLCKILEHQHSQLWPDLHRLPGWKVIIVQSNIWSSQTVFDMVFAFHHGFADGLSGMAFHRTLLQSLNNPNNDLKLPSHHLPIPYNLSLLPPVEQLINFKTSQDFLLKILGNTQNPAFLSTNTTLPWAAKPCSLPSSEEFKSRIKIVSTPASTVAGILAACRKQKATITGLLHGIIVTSLSFRVPTAQKFTSETPYSLRHLTSIPTKDAMLCAASSLSSTYNLETLSSLRSSHSNSSLLMDEIWKIALQFRNSLTEELSHLPNDNPVGAVPYISSAHQFNSSRMNKPRKTTYEISNLGVLEQSGDGEGKEGWRAERMVFSQSGEVNGVAIGVSVTSVGGGPLTVCVSWQEGIVEEDLIDEIVGDLKDALECVGNGDVIRMGTE